MSEPVQPGPLWNASRRPGAALRCDLALRDPVAAWRALAPGVQEEIGAAAIAGAMAVAGAVRLTELGEADATGPYDTAADESQQLLDALVDVRVLRAAPLAPLLPDLRPLGIQQCTGCCCSDTHPCEPPCRWAAPRRCSACTEAPA